jgi:hypothetical protein
LFRYSDCDTSGFSRTKDDDENEAKHEEESSISDAGGWQKALDSAYYKLTLIFAGMPNNTSAIGFLLCCKP